MKNKGSRIASEILAEWNFEKYLKSLYKARLRKEKEKNNNVKKNNSRNTSI